MSSVNNSALAQQLMGGNRSKISVVIVFTDLIPLNRDGSTSVPGYYGCDRVLLLLFLCVCNVFVCFSVPRLRLFLCVISFRHYKHIIMLLNLSSHRLHRHKYIVFTFPSLAVCQFLLCGFKLFKTACETFRPNILTV